MITFFHDFFDKFSKTNRQPFIYQQNKVTNRLKVFQNIVLVNNKNETNKYFNRNSFQQEDTRNKHRKTELSIQFYKFPGNLHQQPAMLEVDLADIIFGKR